MAMQFRGVLVGERVGWGDLPKQSWALLIQWWGGQTLHSLFCHMLTRMVAVGKTTKTFFKLTIMQICVILCVCVRIFTKTELSPPDPVMGRTNIALSLLLYAYKNGGCRQNDKDIFEINHHASLCQCVCVRTYMCHCVRMSVHLLAHIRCLDILLLETHTIVVAISRSMRKQI